MCYKTVIGDPMSARRAEARLKVELQPVRHPWTRIEKVRVPLSWIGPGLTRAWSFRNTSKKHREAARAVCT